MMKRKRRAEYELMKRIERIMEELNFSVDAIIVEGPHDEKALRRYSRSITSCPRSPKTSQTYWKRLEECASTSANTEVTDTIGIGSS